MESEADRPTVWEVRNSLLSTLDHLEDYAHHRPEHASAVSRFSQELRSLKNALMRSLEAGPAQTSLHDIVHDLTVAHTFASIMAERHPEKSAPLTQFVEGLKQAHEEFFREV
jgi:hypothetical protein